MQLKHELKTHINPKNLEAQEKNHCSSANQSRQTYNTLKPRIIDTAFQLTVYVNENIDKEVDAY